MFQRQSPTELNLNSSYGHDTYLKFKQLEKVQVELAKPMNHITFLTTC
jgi:hypothetical protein